MLLLPWGAGVVFLLALLQPGKQLLVLQTSLLLVVQSSLLLLLLLLLSAKFKVTSGAEDIMLLLMLTPLLLDHGCLAKVGQAAGAATGRQPARQALQVWRAAPQVARTVPACRLQGVGPHKVRQPLVMQRLLGGLLLVLPIPCLGVRLLRQVCLWIPLIRTVHLQLCAERCGQGSSIGLPSIAKLAANWLLLPPVLIIHALLVQLTASLLRQPLVTPSTCSCG